LLNPSQIRLAAQLGAALRLSYTVSGGAPGVLARSTLELKSDGRLALTVPDDGSVIVADAVSRRLETLARSLNAVSILLPEETAAVA
jgi:exopolyphosphatase/guanosine-5'-triphosphate,3'-diphosphate pyrophosphatase